MISAGQTPDHERPTVPQRLRSAVRGTLLRFGVDVRFVESVERQRRAEYAEAPRRSWAFLEFLAPGTVLDIGANQGQFARIAASYRPAARIVSFEPLPQCRDALKALQGELPSLEVVEAALGEEPARLSMHCNDSSPSSSLLPIGERHVAEIPKTSHSAPTEVDVKRLDDVASELKIIDGHGRAAEGPLFLKIDVQGYTLPVLRGGPRTVKAAAAVVAEVSCVPLYEGEALFDTIYAEMAELGFEFRGTVDQWVSKQDKSILQMDCLFVNRSAEGWGVNGTPSAGDAGDEHA